MIESETPVGTLICPLARATGVLQKAEHDGDQLPCHRTTRSLLSQNGRPVNEQTNGHTDRSVGPLTMTFLPLPPPLSPLSFLQVVVVRRSLLLIRYSCRRACKKTASKKSQQTSRMSSDLLTKSLSRERLNGTVSGSERRTDGRTAFCKTSLVNAFDEWHQREQQHLACRATERGTDRPTERPTDRQTDRQ